VALATCRNLSTIVFTTTPIQETQAIAICYIECSILLAKKQGQDPENQQYIDKSQNDCYPYHKENTYIKAKNGISTFC
jgi:hypothetical protein